MRLKGPRRKDDDAREGTFCASHPESSARAPRVHHRYAIKDTFNAEGFHDRSRMRDSASSEEISEGSDQSSYWERIGEKLEECLLPLKEDLAEWLNRTFDVGHITAGNLMDVLDSGVLVCQLAKLIYDRSSSPSHRMSTGTGSGGGGGGEGGHARSTIPPFSFKWWPNAQPASFFARDNAANFLRWCRQLGINEALLFESESLVLRTQPRTVVLCLLELARVASKYGIEPPALVKLENEIDETQKLTEKEDVGCSGSNGSGSNGATLERRQKSESGKCCVRERRSDAPSTTTTSTCVSEPDDATCKLHAKVLRIADDHCSRSHVRRISDGKYLIAGRIVFVRLLNERHVMVRVGGGWDTLEHFVSRHKRSSLRSDCCPDVSGEEIQQHLAKSACSSASTTPSSPLGVVIF